LIAKGYLHYIITNVFKAIMALQTHHNTCKNHPKLNNIPLTKFTVSKYEELNANFVGASLSVPLEV
jgi:hypothetical protein